MKRTLSALLLCTALTACKHEGGGVSGAGSAFQPSPRPVTQSSGISINNLDAEIGDARRRMAKGEELERHRLPDLLLDRAGYLGTSEDFDEADTVSLNSLTAEPNDAEVLLARAHVLAALHRFEEALRGLDTALAHGAPSDEVQRSRATILLATGRCTEAAAIWPARAYPVDMVARGALEQRLGRMTAAEPLFESARLEFKDVSPFRFGFIDFERARAYEREGDTVKARAYLEDALDAFPEFAHAAVHVAALVPGDRAIKYLEPVEKRATDPDVVASHADALRRMRRDDDARNMTAKARLRFEEVLLKHPEAYADHAARFFLGAGGDVKRALDLAKGAAARAPSEETLELWALAARAANAKDESCAAARAAEKTTCTLRASRSTLDAARKACN